MNLRSWPLLWLSLFPFALVAWLGFMALAFAAEPSQFARGARLELCAKNVCTRVPRHNTTTHVCEMDVDVLGQMGVKARCVVEVSRSAWL